MRVKTTMLSWLFGLVMGLFLVTGLSQTAFAQDPPGSTCENPLVVDPVVTPLVNFAINSEAYGNNYTSAMITPVSSYLNGNDIVFQFTLTGTSFINASIAGVYTGLIFVGTCPNLATPAPRLAFAGSATGAVVPQFSLEAGTYFMIASTWPAPQFTDMVINFSATIIQEQPNLVVNPSTLDVGMAVPGLDVVSKNITVTNQGLSDAVISQSDFVFTGANADNFSVSLTGSDTYPLSIPFGTSKTLLVNFNPAAAGAASASMAINYNSTNSPANVSLSGTGYLPYAEFSQNFDEVTTIPAGWMPGGWSGIVQSTAPLAVVDVRNVGGPPSLPNHVRLFNSTVTSSVLTLVSPAAVNLSNSWVSFKAKMSTSTHTGDVQVGYLTNRTDPSTFVLVGTVPVTGTYALYSVSFLGSGLTFPETAYIGFRFIHGTASRTLYIDDIVYEVEPVLPIFSANKNEVNFGTSVWINETALNTLQISNTGVGTITINQSDITITGADAASFNINYSGTQTWPITLTTGQTFTFNLAFSPTQVRAYTASLNIQDNIPGKALNSIPLLGSGYDATIQPGFLFDFVGTFPPLDWRRFKGLFGTEPVLPTTDAIWVHDQFGNNPDLVDPNSAKINLYGTTRRHWLMSPPVDLGSGSANYQLEFDLALTIWNQTTPITLAPEQKFAVVISTDGGLTWSMDNVLQWWNETTPISNTGDHIVLDLSNYSGRVMFGFYGEMTVSTSGTVDYDLFVRNVAVTEVIPEPQDVIAMWTFEGDVTTPEIGQGTAALIGGTSATFATGNGGGRAWNTSTYPLQSTNSGTAGVKFMVSTVGYENITVTFDQRASGTASRWVEAHYTIDGTTWNVLGNNNGGLSPHDTFYPFTLEFSSVSGASNNPNFGISLVSIFSPLAFSQNATLSYGANEAYQRANSDSGPPGSGVGTGNYGATGTWRFDNVTFSGDEVVSPGLPSPQNLIATALDANAHLSWDAPALGKTSVTAPWQVEPITGGQVGEAELSSDQGHGVMPTGIRYNVGSQGRSSVLFDNGPFVNAPGAGPDGSDLSQLHSGMTTLGPSISQAGSIRVADDFTVTENWNVESFTFYAYQTATHPTPPVSTITGAYMKIWNGMPDAPGSQVVYGDMTVNALTSSAWTNAYRVGATTPTNTQRPIMSIVCATPGLNLQPGTYYVEWSATGSIASGPWGVPVTINGETNTGNALQYTTTTNAWTSLEMGGTLTGYGLSFLVEGTTGGGGGFNLTGYNIYRDGTLLGSTPATTTSYIDGPLAAGTYDYGVTAVYGAPDPGESAPVSASLTIELPSAPSIAVSPESLSESLVLGTSSSQMVTVSNTGNSALEFELSVTTGSVKSVVSTA
ncbi:MAG: choice-of-anchor D domain-containing protein, partial [Bacteroidales bacterium]|nr:choice-of-anchor D domain-containing protein [Bacteroidales bacterium]